MLKNLLLLLKNFMNRQMNSTQVPKMQLKKLLLLDNTPKSFKLLQMLPMKLLPNYKLKLKPLKKLLLNSSLKLDKVMQLQFLNFPVQVFRLIN